VILIDIPRVLGGVGAVLAHAHVKKLQEGVMDIGDLHDMIILYQELLRQVHHEDFSLPIIRGLEEILHVIVVQRVPILGQGVPVMGLTVAVIEGDRFILAAEPFLCLRLVAASLPRFFDQG